VITVVGEALVDLVVAADTAIAATPGGAPFNVARACARLGAPVSLVAAISTDRFGNRLMADLTTDGVHTDQVQRTERPTTLAVAELDPVGTAVYRFYLEGTSAGTLAAAPLPAITRAVVAGGLGLAVEPMASAVERMVLDAADDVLVLLDLNCRPGAVGDRDNYLARLGRVLARADVVKASTEDLCYTDPTNAPTHVAARLIAGRTRVVLVTAGAEATTVLTTPDTRTVPVTASRVVDTIGAGDGFTAGFVTWWTASGWPLDDLADLDAVVPAVDAAHQVATAVVARTGADPPHRDDLPPDWGPDVTRQAADRGSPSGRTHKRSRQ
jgi:fructokinase